MIERLHKILAQRGVCSRRAAEQLILDGHVSVNGFVVDQLGHKADSENDEIRVDGKKIPSARTARTLMLHKPCGYLSTCSIGREHGKSVLELIPSDRRYYPVGRLDKNSSGLLLLTDDGDLAYKLTHPSQGVEKVYEVATSTPITKSQMAQMICGIKIGDQLAHAVSVTKLHRDIYRIVLKEGRKRQIRYMLAELGSGVVSLKRVQIGGLRLDNLQVGEWRELTDPELDLLVAATKQ